MCLTSFPFCLVASDASVLCIYWICSNVLCYRYFRIFSVCLNASFLLLLLFFLSTFIPLVSQCKNATQYSMLCIHIRPSSKSFQYLVPVLSLNLKSRIKLDMSKLLIQLPHQPMHQQRHFDAFFGKRHFFFVFHFEYRGIESKFVGFG